MTRISRKWEYIWIASFGAFMAHVGLTWQRWELYVALFLVIAYGVSKERTRS